MHRREAQDGEDGMDDWDQDKLEDVVKQKHGAEKPSNKTDIICKFFLDAVESKLYGWSVAVSPLSAYVQIQAYAKSGNAELHSLQMINVSFTQA